MILHPLYACVISLFVFASSVSLGLRLCAVFSLDHARSVIERGLIAFGIGSGVISLIMLCIGSLGILYASFAACLLLMGLLWGRRDLIEWTRCATEECVICVRRSRFIRWSSSLLICFCLLNGFAALAPPSDVDALNYHLAVPHIYALHHRIIPLPSIYHSYFPFGIQMLYTICLLFHSPVAAQCLHVAFGLANITVIGVIARRFYGNTTACLAMLLFYTLPDVSAEIPAARIDLGTSFYALLSLLQMIDNCRSVASHRKMLLLAGCFAGLCAGTKYTALIVPLIISALALISRQGLFSIRIKHAIIVGVIALSVAMPWYLRNAVWTSNPVFPFFSDVFPSEAAVAEHVRQANWNYATVHRTVWNFLISPWLLLVTHDAFASNQIGPLFLTYLPIYILVRWHRLQRISLLLSFCFFWAPFWFWTSPLIRFFFAPVAIFCIPLAQAFRVGMRYSRWFRRGTISSVFLWLTFCVISNIRYHALLIAAAFGGVPVEAFLNTTTMFQVYHYEDFQVVNSTENIRKILLHGSHGLFINKPFELADEWTTTHQPLLKRCELRDVKTILQESGITHILLNTDTAPLPERDRMLWTCLQKTYGNIAADTPIYQRETVKLFKLMETP